MLRSLEQTPAPTAIEEQLAKLTQQVASLAAGASQTTDRKKYKQVAVRDVHPTARLENPPAKSDGEVSQGCHNYGM